MKGMILAAGYGTRFRPATYLISKPMVPVCNRPLIAYAVDSLLSAGVRDIIVNLHHLPEQIESYLRVEYAGKCAFSFSLEPEILGTGGGVRKVRPMLESEEVFYLVNGDTIQAPPFADLHIGLADTGSLASLLLRHAPADDRFTPVMFDGQLVTGFGAGRGEALMFAGAHAVSRRIFDYLPDRDFSGLTEDVYLPVAAEGRETIAGTVYDGLWFDIGTPRRYLTASSEMLALILNGRLPTAPGSRADQRSAALIGSDSDCVGEVERSVVGDRCRIRGGASVRNSVLWNDIEISADARIEESVIAHRVSVPARAQIGNALLCRRTDGIEYEYDPSMTFAGEFVATPIDPQRPLLLDFRGS